jgi:proteasome accessory factor A
MRTRITGLETEYGCLVQPPARSDEILPRVRDWLFENQRYGLIDLHPRGWDEPAGNGGFLFNGGRVYIDMGHLEYCTPECACALDVVRYDRAGDLLLLEALRALGLEDKVCFIRNNVDHYTGATFGCHENYSLERTEAVTKKNWASLLSFLTLRVLFTGTGRVGGSFQTFFGRQDFTGDDSVPFQISQRADFILNDCFEWIQHNRSILNLRDEPLADARRFRRLHLIHGDTNVLPTALFLKVGATRLVLDLLEVGEMPQVVLADPVTSFRSLSRCSSAPWRVTMADNTTADALGLLAQYYRKAKKMFHGRDAETDSLLQLWARTLDGLSSDTDSLIGIVDWISKKHLLDAFVAREALSWDDPWLKAQDLEFHQIDPTRSFGLALAQTNDLWNLDDLNSAKRDPPANSRAHARSRLMREIQGKECSYHVDWAEVSGPDEKHALLPNPFQC